MTELRRLGQALVPLEQICRGGTVSGMTDAELLARFTANKDRRAAEVAFEALITRHGPMVFGLCRSRLNNPIDAEDAFQATFMVLARKAPGLHVADSIGRWLNTVAIRVANRARKRAVRQLDRFNNRASELAAVTRDDGPESAAIAAEHCDLIQAEVAELPEDARRAITLCHLEGLSLETAAAVLHWPIGTLKGRLFRARKLLRNRLERKGIAPAILFPVVPEVLKQKTLEAVLSVTTCRSLLAATAAGTSPVALQLTQGTLSMMTGSKVLGVGLVAITLGLSALVGGTQTQSPSFEADPVKPSLLALEPDRDQAVNASPFDLDPPHGPSLVFKDLQDSQRSNAEAEVIALRNQVNELTEELASLRKQMARVTEMGVELNLMLNEESEASPQGAGDVAPPEKSKAPLHPSDRRWDRENPPRELDMVPHPDYRIQPPDKIRVEVFEALPGRPITGERVVRPDGTISLDFYGELRVSGMTTTEVEEAVILHLRNFLNDETLGLASTDPVSGEIVYRTPADSDLVFVDVAAYNSKNYYVFGDFVQSTGRVVLTGHDTVLDAITYSGGLLPTADPTTLRLVRPAPKGSDRKPLTLKIDLDGILNRGETTTNYQLFDGDRLIVDRKPPVEFFQNGDDPRSSLKPPVEFFQNSDDPGSSFVPRFQSGGG